MTKDEDMGDFSASRTLGEPNARRGSTFLVALLLGGMSCHFGPPPLEPPDGSQAADADQYFPADGDGDGDGDGDADRDAWPPLDAGEYDEDSIGARETTDPVIGLCLDGEDQSSDVFDDCFELGCLTSRGCCLDQEREWLRGQFLGCVRPEDCGWTSFPAEAHAVELAPPWAVLSSAPSGETGLYTDQVVEATGEPLLTFAMALDAPGCSAEGCRQTVGVALTLQESLSSSTGVSPVAGIVIDGEAGGVHFVVNGRIESSISYGATEAVTAPVGAAIRLLANGRVAFWFGLDVDALGETLAVSPDGHDPVYTSNPTSGISGQRLRVALFGHFRSGGSGRVGGVELERPICDNPSAFARDILTPVVVPDGAHDRVGGPSVVRRPDGAGLLMAYEADGDLAVAASSDGVGWEVAGDVFTALAPTEYGRVARGSPSLLFMEPRSFAPGYHLWFEAESEYSGILAGDLPRSAIVHATSEDGVSWYEEPEGESIAFVGDGDHPWRMEVGQPSVVVMSDQTLLMFFVGTQTATGITSLGWATSTDWKSWQLSDDRVDFDDGLALGFERDGLGHPHASLRGEVVHLWYAGYSGSHAAIGYAVGRFEGHQAWVWSRFGEVLGPTQQWEAQRVLAPSVVILPAEEFVPPDVPIVGVLSLWFEGGTPGMERIGLVAREIPARLEDLYHDEP